MKLATGLCSLLVIISYAYGKPYPHKIEEILKQKTSLHDVAKACSDLAPIHGHSKPQTGPFPYTITTDVNSIQPSGKIEVKISGKNGETFRGFMVQARNSDNEIVNGKFERTNSVGLIDCLGGKENTATNAVHPDHTDRAEIKLIWVAPEDLNEDIKFLVTIVKSYSEFWVGQTSDIIKVIGQSSPALLT